MGQADPVGSSFLYDKNLNRFPHFNLDNTDITSSPLIIPHCVFFRPRISKTEFFSQPFLVVPLIKVWAWPSIIILRNLAPRKFWRFVWRIEVEFRAGFHFSFDILENVESAL